MLNVRHIALLVASCMLCATTLVGQKLSDPKIAKRKPQGRTYSDPKIRASSIDWKATRLEFIVGGGASGFLGDLGGQNNPGKPFIYDYEPTTTRYGASIGARYFMREYQAIRGYFTYGEVTGSDALTTYPNRRYRNLNFKSPIAELSAIYEWHFLKPAYIHFAGASSTKLFSGNRFGLYLSAGAGVFYFNPQGKLGSDYYALQPLRTEGQGFPDGPSPYKRVNFTFPLGGGAYMLLNKNFTLGVDFGMRFAATDYIDDASGYYYDNAAILARDGKLASYFANPSVALTDVPNRDWYTANQPRGGSQSNDTYMFLQVTLSKSFTPSVSNKAFKQKKRPKANAYPKSKKKDKYNKKGGQNKSYKKSKKVKNPKRKFKAPNLRFGKRQKRSRITTF
jgi:hypothetical protein